MARWFAKRLRSEPVPAPPGRAILVLVSEQENAADAACDEVTPACDGGAHEMSASDRHGRISVRPAQANQSASPGQAQCMPSLGSFGDNEGPMAELLVLTKDGRLLHVEVIGTVGLPTSPSAIIIHGRGHGARINVKDYKYPERKK